MTSCSLKFRVGALLIAVAAAAEGQWGRFRGPNGTGVDVAAGYPVEFSPSKNVVWKRPIPYGQSSPVVADGLLYLTARENGSLTTICIDARTGAELWRRQIERDRFAMTYKANDPASPTPAADSDGVVVFFPDFGLAAYTKEGKDRWTVPLGPFQNFYGMAASPILAGNMLILVCDQQSRSYILALDAKSGQQRWKTERPGATVGWATPMVFRPSRGQAQLIVLGSTRVDSYYLETGESRWWMPVGSEGGIGTPVVVGDTVLISSLGTGQPWMPRFESVLATYDKDHDGRLSRTEFEGDKDLGQHFGWIDSDGDNFISAKEWAEARNMGAGESGAIAIRANTAQGKLDPQSVVWRFKKNLPFIPAPLVYRDIYFMIRDGGIITSLDPVTGKLLKEGRNREALGQYYASPVAADGKIFLASGEGKMTVLKAGAQWEVLATNDLDEEIHATPALSGGRIYVRTRGLLYCFGASEAKP
jgi:outer membrane protein assembly factor BamB